MHISSENTFDLVMYLTLVLLHMSGKVASFFLHIDVSHSKPACPLSLSQHLRPQAGNTLDRWPVHHRIHTHLRTVSVAVIHLIWMCLDCVGKWGTLSKPMRTQGVQAKSTQTGLKPETFLLWENYACWFHNSCLNSKNNFISGLNTVKLFVNSIIG